MSTMIRLPYLTLLIAVAMVADSTIADWLRVHWDVALSGLIVIIGGLWVSTTTGLSTTGTMSVGGASTLTGTTTLVASDNLCAGMQFTGIGAAAAGKIGLNANQLGLFGGSSGHGFFNAGGGLTTGVDASGNWSMAGRINSATLQPGFLATGTGQSLTPGISATVTLGTEVYDEAGNFSANTFTAPIPGRYLILFRVATNASTGYSAVLSLVTSNRTYVYSSSVASAEIAHIAAGVITDMDAGDTAHLTISMTGTGVITGDAYMSGRLMP